MQAYITNSDSEIYRLSSNNRSDLIKSNQCGCFYCLKVFNPKEIGIWIENDETAICPFCKIDAVIGDKSVEVFDEALLKQMNEDRFQKYKAKPTNNIKETSFLKAIAVGIVDDRVFCSEQIPKDQMSKVFTVFLPLAFMKPSDRIRIIDSGASVFWEETRKAAPTWPDGFPIFTSLNTLNAEEWNIVVEKIKEYEEAKKSSEKQQ